ncbi:hypothetical protein [Macromonas bipunctata]|uniref:hypothetical protein n=1 Tax=Macromonas bipunctata TaxID=183670 RepID=UPI000C31DBB0|nr:hypothetical protein [Macromonas bipunctata]
MATDKAAPAGVLCQLLKACPTFKPESHEMVAFYRQQIAEQFHERIADPLGVPRFSPLLMAEIAKKLKNPEAAEILHVAVRMGNFGNRKEHELQRRDVKKLMDKAGHTSTVGKRVTPGLDEFVDCVVPLLLHYGVKFSTSETSRMVNLLDLMAKEIGLTADPRNELRRRRREQLEINARLVTTIKAAVWRGLEPLRQLSTEK